MTFEAILADEFEGKIRLDDMIDDAAIDSLDYIVFIKRLEDEFHVLLTDAELAKAATFRHLSVIVDRMHNANLSN